MNIRQDTIVRPLPSAELIKKHEQLWRRSLPESFLQFSNEYHGAETAGVTFECNGRVYALERFLCILDDVENHPQGMYDIDVVVSQIGERLTGNEDLLGVEMLPIASVFAGDFVCLDFRTDPNAPSVCVWSHEESGEFEPVTYPVAANFPAFLTLLEKNEEQNG